MGSSALTYDNKDKENLTPQTPMNTMPVNTSEKHLFNHIISYEKLLETLALF